MKCGSGGFTLIEVIVSISILAIVATGFSVVITKNTLILNRGYHIEQHSFTCAALIENRAGQKTERFETLIFEGISGDIEGEFRLYEYKVQNDSAQEAKSYDMFYFDYQ